MFSSIRRVSLLKLNKCHMVGGCLHFSSNPPQQQNENVTSTFHFSSQRYYDLSGNNAGLTRREFQARRVKLAENLASQSPLLSNVGDGKMIMDRSIDTQKNHLVIIPSAQRQYMVDKIPYLFRQATNFRYLTGSKSHNSALVLRFNGLGQELVTTLLLPDVNLKEDIWEGPQMKADEALDVFGVDEVFHMEDLAVFLNQQINLVGIKNLVLWYDYLNPTHKDIHRTVMRLIEGSPIQPVQSPRMAVQRQRLLKSPQEIAAMRKAAQISAEAINATMRTTSEHNSETKLFAKLDYESRVRGADFLAYPPVVACGDNANVIHYTRYSSNQYVKDDLVLVDCGCDVGGYASDITRTWPLSGRFSDAQKLIYQVVLDIHRQLLSALSENAGKLSVDHLYKLMQAALGQHLLNIGLIPSELANDSFRLNEAASEFCPHHVSHYLGLDVHDTALGMYYVCIFFVFDFDYLSVIMRGSSFTFGIDFSMEKPLVNSSSNF